MNLRQFLDPDKQWFSRDKYQHGASFVFAGFLSMAIISLLPLSVLLCIVSAIVVCAVIAVVYELGQTDVAYSQMLLGTPGYGISPLDLVWDMAGTVVGIALYLAIT